jgi:hypothetical protein
LDSAAFEERQAADAQIRRLLPWAAPFLYKIRDSGGLSAEQGRRVRNILNLNAANLESENVGRFFGQLLQNIPAADRYWALYFLRAATPSMRAEIVDWAHAEIIRQGWV